MNPEVFLDNYPDIAGDNIDWNDVIDPVYAGITTGNGSQRRKMKRKQSQIQAPGARPVGSPLRASTISIKKAAIYSAFSNKKLYVAIETKLHSFRLIQI